MNTKLLAGISLAAMAGSFWACGEGQINGKEFSDTIVESMYDTPEALESLKEQAKTDCWQNDPACAALYGSYVDPNASNPVVSSAAVIMSSSSIYQPPLGESSSSEEVINNHGRSSSSIVFASSAVEVSSSSETVPATGLGSCKPTKNPIKKGESTTWSFSRNSSNGIAASKYQGSATYQWKFVGGSIPEDNTKFTSAEVTYMNPGKTTASVVVTLTDGSSEEIPCSPLQVNGDDITGCECNPTVDPSIDISQNPVATWTVTGCQTSSMPLTYEWEAGIAGDGANGGYQFTEAGTKAPSVTVHNNDSTAIKVTCGAVKGTDGPEYQIAVLDSIKKVPLGACVDIKVSGNLRCAHDYQPNECEIVVTYKEKSTTSVKDSFCNNTNGTPVSVEANTQACLSGTGTEEADCRVTAW